MGRGKASGNSSKELGSPSALHTKAPLQLTEGLHLKDDNWNFVSVDNSEQGTWPRVKGQIVTQIIPTWEHLEEDNIPTACPVHNITEVKTQVGWFELQEDKVQRMPPWRYLGLEIGKRTIVPQKIGNQSQNSDPCRCPSAVWGIELGETLAGPHN
ncbi:hypothetical protein DUI87_31006 [Hirundo rustica rustica]|uniref:Uncharacterized protein n=1 Tax=Hirundo rustica rustica TaxID=333673 RepID=A0A3M0IV61_HIRRU|nr:hypothetical protein DUI87_31006 [Hirundo rustica rustica]